MGNMIEVGEYVRTETGFIRRIKSVDKTEATEKCPVNMYWCNLDKPIKILKECSKDTIYAIEMSDAKKLKHSNNILDLIEPGDLVRIFVEENVDENGTTEDTCVYEVTTTQVKDFYGNKLEEIIDEVTKDTCTYEQIEEDYNVWHCNKCKCDWCLEEGTPKDNNMNYCPECGARIKEIIEIKEDE